MYKVIKSFFDLDDKNYEYKEGQIFPRKGAKVSEDRIEELLSGHNKLKKPLIKEVKEQKKKKSE